MEVKLETAAVAYRIIQSRCKTHGAEGVTVFGVEAVRIGSCTEQALIADISANRNDVEKLITYLEEGEVTPDQLIYISEDYLADLYTV